jgi:Na+-driven multidrug efflux pump
MSQSITIKGKVSSFFSVLKQAIKGKEVDLTSISIKRAIVLLAIPMMLEMAMESVFALVDLYFVGHLKNSSHAIQTVGLTESVLTVIYSLAIGLSMAATAVVARRIGEKNPEAASKAGMQTIVIAVFINLAISILGFLHARDLLLIMGASTETADHGTPFVRIMMGGSLIIVLLFLINGIFRGAGNAAVAMRSLWIANMANIILCPIFIRGLGPIPVFGLTGAAIATSIGRGLGVTYQIYNLFNGKNALKIRISYFIPDWHQIKAIIKIAAPGIFGTIGCYNRWRSWFCGLPNVIAVNDVLPAASLGVEQCGSDISWAKFRSRACGQGRTIGISNYKIYNCIFRHCDRIIFNLRAFICLFFY